MKVIVVAQQKGGVGKTAASAHIAFHAAEQGARVLVVDLDPQGNLSLTMKDQQDLGWAVDLFHDTDVADAKALADLLASGGIALLKATAELADLASTVPLDVAMETFSHGLMPLAESFDLCVIDTPPGLSVAQSAALHSADAVISPIELDEYSISGIEQMMLTVMSHQELNQGLTFLGMVPSKVDRRNPRHTRYLAQLQQEEGLPLAPVVLGLRSSVAQALGDGVPVWTSGKTAARAAGAEMHALGQYVMQSMEVKHAR